MTEENMPASAPAEQHSQPAEYSPAQETHYQQPAHEAEETTLSDILRASQTDHEEPADEHEEHDQEGEQPDRPKKLSGAQRAKAQKEYLQNELRAREDRIAELERHIGERDENDRQSESERNAEAQRKRHDAHHERIKEAKGAITDFDVVMARMRDVTVPTGLIDDIMQSDKSPLLVYHLAQNPDKLRELDSMNERERAREIGRLEATLKIPTGKKMTTAPPPPSRLTGGADPHTRLEDVGDMKTFAARLIKTLDARKRR